MGFNTAITDLIRGYTSSKKTVKSKNTGNNKKGNDLNIGGFASKFGSMETQQGSLNSQLEYVSKKGSESNEERVRAIFSYCTPSGYNYEEELKDRMNALSIDKSVVQSKNFCNNGFFTTASNDCSDPFFWFFGEPDQKYIQRYNVKDETTHTLPTPFLNEECCDRIADTVEQAVFLDGSWHFIVAPITPTTSNKICWSTIEYAPAIAEIVPDYGQVKLLTSSRKSGSATFNQRGIGARFHHGFMSTPEGIRHYLRTLSQMARSIEATNKYQILHKLTSTADQIVCYDLCHSTYEGRTAVEVYQDDVDNWDGFKKNPMFMHHIDTKISEKQRAMGAEVADTWIIPPQITGFVTQMETALTDPTRVGAIIASNVFNDGPDALTTFRGSRIYVSRVMERDCETAVDPLKFKEEIGEFFRFLDDAVHCCSDPSTHKSCYDNIQIYDEDHNKFVTISYIEALKRTGRFNPDGSVASFPQSPALTNFTQNELGNDPLYMQHDGKLVPNRYFINVPDSKLNAKSRIKIGESVKKSLSSGGVVNIDRAEELLSIAKQAIRQMEQYSYTDATQYWDIIRGNLGAALASNRADRPRSANEPLFLLQEYGVDGTGFNDFTYTNVDVGTRGLPAGHQSWHGFKKLAQVWKGLDKDDQAAVNASVFKNVDRRVAQGIADFVTLVEGVVAKLRLIFPSSEALNVRNASSWWQRPEAETVLFQNFIHKHRVPVWTAAGTQAGAADVGFTQRLVQTYSLQLDQITTTAQQKIQALNAVDGVQVPQNIQRVATLANLDEGNQNLPSAQNNFVGPIGLGGLTQDNYALYRPAIFASVVLSLLLSNIDENGDPEKLQRLLTRIEDDIVLKELATNQQIIEGYNTAALFNAIKALYSKKNGFSDILEGNYASFKARAQELLETIEEAPASIPNNVTNLAAPGPDGYVRTTLLSWPRFIEGLAQQVQQNEAVEWTISDPDLPDLVITTSKILKEVDLQERADQERSPAFIESDVVEMMEHLDLSRVARTVEFAKQYDQELSGNASIESEMRVDSLDGNNNDMIGADFGDDDQEGDFGVGGTNVLFGLPTTDLRFPSAAAAPKVSKAALAQGLQHFSQMPAFLFTSVARENFTKLAACDDDSWAVVFAFVFNYAQVTEETLKRMDKFDVMKPFDILLMRPHMRYHCLRAIKMKRGASTIRMYQKRGRACAGDNCELEEHFIQYKYQSNAVIINPKNICVLKCAFVTEYLGGGGVKWIDRENYNPQQRYYGGDLISALIGRDEVLPGVLNLSGYDTETEELYQLADSEGRSQYSSSGWVNAAYRLARGKRRHSESCETEFITECDYVNQIMHKGVRRHCDPVTQQWVVSERGNGHWGLIATYDGANPARLGKESYQSLVRRR